MMKNELASRRLRAILCGFTGLSSTLVAAQAADPAPRDDSGWTVSASANALFNVSAKFSGHPQTPALTNPNLQPGAVNYDNGYVGRDISGDPGLSTYWGYTQAGQPIIPGGGLVTGLNYQLTTVGAEAVSPKRDADTSFGGEITARREIFQRERFRAGLELGFNFDPVSIKDSAGYTANAQQTSVSYALAAPVSTVLFPPPGYLGPFNGAGPNIIPTPIPGATTVVPNASVITGSRKVDADVFGFRLGPYLELPITDRFSASVSAGALVTVVRDEVTWSETLAVNTTTTGFWTGTSSVAGSSSGVTAGFYAGLDASYRFCRNWSAVCGARFLDSGTYSHSLGAGKMELDLGQAFTANLGLSWTF